MVQVSRIILCLLILLWTTGLLAQSGRSVVSGRRTTLVNVIAKRVADPSKPRQLLGSKLNKDEPDPVITKQDLSLFDGGISQKIEAFSPDPSPARIVILMDNSATLQADVKKLAAVPAAFAPEIYEGDKVMVIGYDLKPEVITEFTDDPKALQGTLSLLRKSDAPKMLDAMNVVMEDVLRPEVQFSKRVIVLVGDGLDRGSTTKFDPMLATLQNENVTIYAIQVRDRTRGAMRKDGPKPIDALQFLTTGTGGRIYPFDGDIKQTVKDICDELRNDRYQLTYFPEGVNPINKRFILLTTGDQGVSLRYKAFHPPQ
jgi:Ca-activated chloride channel family protein